MCPENMTNLEDGSNSCDAPVRPGTNLTLRYAVIVSFGVYLNGTTLEEIAAKVGCCYLLHESPPLQWHDVGLVCI